MLVISVRIGDNTYYPLAPKLCICRDSQKQVSNSLKRPYFNKLGVILLLKSLQDSNYELLVNNTFYQENSVIESDSRSSH